MPRARGSHAKVAEDPSKNPSLFQQFLDRHTNLRDLIETEEALVTYAAGECGPF